MLGKVFCAICAISFIFAAITGNMEALATSVIDGAAKAVTLTISLLGLTALWCGVMEIYRKCGICRLISKLISPLLSVLFPESKASGIGIEEISANISANLLGLGNAATPFGIKAMQAMSVRSRDGYASDDMVTFVVLNTSSVSLMPTTLIALRRAAGAVKPFDIIVAVWICSFVCMCVSMFFARTLRIFFRRGKPESQAVAWNT